MSVTAIVVAAGRGVRAGSAIPKQYAEVGGEPVVRKSLRIFVDHPEIAEVVPVIHSDDEDLFEKAAAGLSLHGAVQGGETRQESVWAGLEVIAAKAPSFVLIHDAARPFASSALVSRAIAAMETETAAIPGLPVSDTVKSLDQNGRIATTLNRARLRIVQTPQAFHFAPLLEAHRRAAAAGLLEFPDDAALAEWAGLKVGIFDGEIDNVKLTNPEDFERAEAFAASLLPDIRTGTGFDVHAFGDGDHVMLGGVRIPHERGLSGHSDADVLLHALTDAVLGALADGDIGQHFPPTDKKWKGASSDQFLSFAVARVSERKGIIAHLDATIICEQPRIGAHRDAMRAKIASIAGIEIGRVGVKATTSEKLGFTGRGEGIAAMASATIRLPGGVS